MLFLLWPFYRSLSPAILAYKAFSLRSQRRRTSPPLSSHGAKKAVFTSLCLHPFFDDLFFRPRTGALDEKVSLPFLPPPAQSVLRFPSHSSSLKGSLLFFFSSVSGLSTSMPSFLSQPILPPVAAPLPPSRSSSPRAFLIDCDGPRFPSLKITFPGPPFLALL